MGMVGNVMNAAGAALYAFKESMLNADPQGRRASLDFGVWDRWEARMTRFDLNWSMYQGNSYRDLVHPWSARYKTAYGMYKHARHLYNPAYRLGEFYAGHLMAGSLDMLAGDGASEPSALPILTENQSLRPAVAKFTRDSKWQVKKEHYTRWGAVLGAVGLKQVDDERRRLVRSEIVHPGQLKWVDWDDLGNVKAYLIQRWEYDPRDAGIADMNPDVDPQSRQRPVIYQEKCYRDGDDVVTEYYLNGVLYPWKGNLAVRVEKYGFVPLVICHHEIIGMDWGACCFHSGFERFREVDNLASGLSDQVDKAIRAPMLMAGVKAPGATLRSAQADRSKQSAEDVANNPEPSRTQQDYLYTPETQARAQHLTFNLDIPGVIAHIAGLNGDIEKNYPELLADTGNLGGTVTAEAIRNARQQASTKVQARRVSYDDAWVRAMQMGISMGGSKGYKGYEGFDLDSFGAGKLEMRIGNRAVFEVDPMDAINEDSAFWGAIDAQVKVGVPLALALERNGWSEQDLKALADAKAKEPAPAAAVAVVAAKPGETPQGAAA